MWKSEGVEKRCCGGVSQRLNVRIRNCNEQLAEYSNNKQLAEYSNNEQLAEYSNNDTILCIVIEPP